MDDYNNNSNIYINYNEYNFENYEYYDKIVFIMNVVTCIIIAIGFPLTLVAIYALYSLVRSDHVAPIYVINLLFTDLIQLCCMIVQVKQPEDWTILFISFSIYYFVQIASVYFMVCVSLERYLVIAHPLWYRFRRTIKTSVAVCVVVWVLTLVCVILYYFSVNHVVTRILLAVLLTLPFPLFIFFLVGTLRALSASVSVPSDDKRWIWGILVLLLLIYTLLFLPTIIWFLGAHFNYTLINLSHMFLRLSPLADLVLCVFMRKGARDKLLASVCCRMDSNQPSISMNDDNISTVSLMLAEKEGERERGGNRRRNVDEQKG
ncbi:G-protein coupled receptor 4-like [Micropterus salmoides]|uniref:G-protein coupled receptor 4-like n=1 Tax=Micropterus salmoides TaxID=27706 RepID=UPI0018EC84D5|nr:G-protein coupled receptor 4-like [Micropterus salmoides]